MRYIIFSIGINKFCINEEHIIKFYDNSDIHISHEETYIKKNIAGMTSLKGEIIPIFNSFKIFNEGFSVIYSKFILLRINNKKIILPVSKIFDFIESDEVHEINSFFKKVVVKNNSIYPLIDNYFFE